MSAGAVTETRFSSRGWVLFALMSVLWGVPYLFIAQAVESYSPAAVVAGRCLVGALLLLPVALYRRALVPALKKWPWVLLFAVIEIAIPWLLLGHAEQTLPSGTTGLLVATVPLFAAIIAFVRGDRSLARPVRAIGLVIGFAGVAVIVAGPGLAVGAGIGGLVAVGEVLIVAICYAIAPFIIATKLEDVPSVGSITLSLAVVGIVYLPIGLLTQHQTPTLTGTMSILALGVLCTAIAFMAFFALIGEVGPARAGLFTYVNPIVAIALGAIILGEHLSPGLLVGFPLVLVGCWLVATGGVLPRRGRQLPPVAPS